MLSCISWPVSLHCLWRALAENSTAGMRNVSSLVQQCKCSSNFVCRLEIPETQEQQQCHFTVCPVPPDVTKPAGFGSQIYSGNTRVQPSSTCSYHLMPLFQPTSSPSALCPPSLCRGGHCKAGMGCNSQVSVLWFGGAQCLVLEALRRATAACFTQELLSVEVALSSLLPQTSPGAGGSCALQC